MASLMPNGKQQYFDPNSGAPLAGGKLFTYVGGTSTPKDTWQDSAATIKNSNPIILDAAGSAVVFWSGNYKVQLQDALGNVIYTVDNYSTDSREHPVQVEVQTATAGQTVFNLAQTTYTPGINSLHVYVDGLRMFMPDYAETNGTVVTFASALVAGQVVMFECGSAANSQSSIDAANVPYTPGGGGAATNVAASLNGKTNTTDLAAAGGAAMVGFQQAGTGSVLRTAQDELRGWINPAQYGAALNNTTDDTAAVQRAINVKGVGTPVSIRFPAGAKVKIAGTIYLPPLATIDLNGAVLTGSGTNVMFESGYWSAGAVVSNFGQANESQIVYATSVFNGQITNADKAFHLFNFCESSSVREIRFTSVNQAIYAQRCFYGSFRKLLSRTPLDGTKYPCYNLSDSVNAIECESVFAVNYTLGWQLDGSKDNFLGINCGAESCTTGVKVLNSTSSAKFLGWYFENTPTAFNFDAGGNHTNIDIENTWFNTVTTAVTGSTILTGRFRANNRLGSAALSLGANFSNGLIVEIPNDTTANTATAALPAGYTLGDTVRVDYVKAIYDSATGLVTSKGEIHAGALPMRYSGGSGLPKSGTVPFCTVTVTATQITIDTQINYMNLEMVGYAIQVTDGSPINLSGRIAFCSVLADTGFATKAVAVSNNGGYMRLTISGLTAATACTGIVRHLG